MSIMLSRREAEIKAMFLTTILAVFLGTAFAQTYTGEPSNRIKINLGETPWKFMKGDFYTGTPNARDIAYNDASWSSVGIPHCYNATDTWLNATNGRSNTYSGIAWYRKRLTVPASYAGKRIELEFQGVNVGCAVYVNGTFKPGISKVAQPADVTHVCGHLPFIVDITNDVKPGEENIIAVRVANKSGTLYVGASLLAAGDHASDLGGINNPVYMHITDKVHVPLNIYSNTRRWGTFVGATAATDASATVRLQTNVYNDDTQSKSVVVVTKVVDAKTNNVVATQTSTAQTINAGSNHVFDQTATIANPKLWYPNNTVGGKPNMHKVYHIVQVNGQTVDVFTTPLGIRVITWDKDFAYFNGKKHVFWGFGCRYEYPAFGMAIPEEQRWRDIKLMADCGGSMLRPGHVPIAEKTVEACDAYGVCLFNPSGDKEWALHGEPTLTYKDEFHRDCIIRDRNHPSVAVWEMDNGNNHNGGWIQPQGWWQKMIDTVKHYDYIAPRASSTRDQLPFTPSSYGELILGVGWEWSRRSTAVPVWAAEVWNIRNTRYSYNYEIQFTDKFMQQVVGVLRDKGVGYIHWMFMECSGENYATFLDASFSADQRKSLGASAVDHNRIPKLVYNVYKNAAWVPYDIRPGVALQSHWNYSSGNRTVTAYSNCPSVELFVNGASKGVKTPDASTTKCEWTNVAWESGTLKAVGRDASGTEVCSDERKTAGAPKKIVLTVEPAIVRPDNGQAFKICANGTDAAFILATIVDDAGNWCPLATNNITFNVSGEGTYVGSSNYIADLSKPATYHAPGDPELAAEGGMMKIGVRATFTPGAVTVGASASGLTAATPVTFQTYDINSPVVATRPAAILPAAATRARNATFKIAGTSFMLPGEFAGKLVSMKIYDLSGRLVRQTVVRGNRISLPRHGITATGTFIVRCREIAPAANE